jgi:hypothetical protein
MTTVLGEYFDLSLLGHGKQPVELKQNFLFTVVVLSVMLREAA